MNFYLKHPLMAAQDPRMKKLLKEEGLKGFGAYWIIIEKLGMLPDSYAEFEYLRPFCKEMRLSFAYIKKIILNYELFTIYEDGYFEPEELNPPRKRGQKMSKSVPELAKSEAKNDENRQKTPLNKTNFEQDNSANILKHASLAENGIDTIKENIKDIIITTATTEEKEETAVAADDIFGGLESDDREKTQVPFCMPKAGGGVCPFGTASAMTQLTVPNDTAHQPKPRSLSPSKCVIGSA